MHPKFARVTIKGEPASKANSRRIVRNAKTGLPMVVKSKKALSYVDLVAAQVPIREPLMEGELQIIITIWYASKRPDLDESVILDALQGRIYKNDRQIWEKHVYREIDRDNPRAIVTIKPR